MKDKKGIRYIEPAFNILYLCSVAGLGIYMAFDAEIIVSVLFSVMALVLVMGDSFHLVPRIIMSIRGSKTGLEKPLGMGKMMASICMTLFYIILWHIGILCFVPDVSVPFTVLVYFLAVSRIILILMPQNKWSYNTHSHWNIYRNIPFIMQGFIVGVLFFIYRNSAILNFKWMWLAIVLSFAFYIPVVLGVKKYPALGMLMLPKSCAYVWMIVMGLNV